jgi:hypothetical protein
MKRISVTGNRTESEPFLEPMRAKHHSSFLLLAPLTLCCALAPGARAQTPLPDNFNPGANLPVAALAVQAPMRVVKRGE